jgi:hypothetical protein
MAHFLPATDAGSIAAGECDRPTLDGCLEQLSAAHHGLD